MIPTIWKHEFLRQNVVEWIALHLNFMKYLSFKGEPMNSISSFELSEAKRVLNFSSYTKWCTFLVATSILHLGFEAQVYLEVPQIVYIFGSNFIPSLGFWGATLFRGLEVLQIMFIFGSNFYPSLGFWGASLFRVRGLEILQIVYIFGSNFKPSLVDVMRAL